MMLPRHLSFVLFLLAGSACLVACGQPGKNLFEQLNEMLNRYADGYIQTTGLVTQDLLALLEAYDKLSEADREAMSQNCEYRLAVDLAFKPVFRMPEILTIKSASTVDTMALYLKRFEETYKELRPVCKSRIVGDGYMKKTPKMHALVDAIKADSPVTIDMALAAQREYNSYKRQLDAIATHEDVYAMKDIYILVFNAVNHSRSALLNRDFFPYIGEATTKKDLAAVVQKFKRSLKDYPWIS